jgi:internalin A
MTNKELLQIIRQAAKDKRAWLDLSGNNLISLPPEIGRLQNLTSLNLSGNCLTSLPSEIGQLQNLISLDLSKNQLKSLTLKIARLQNLTWLNLSENLLTTLPACVTHLPDLTWLYLNGNRIQSLRSEISQLKNLIELHLGNNRLTDLPEAITLLQNLTELHLSGNSLDLPAEILERSPQAEPILNFYRQLQEYGEESLAHDGKRLPRSWIKVRSILEKHSSNYITQEEYFHICQRSGFTQVEDKLQLSRYLHELEICRHFQDDLFLKDVIILKPSWIQSAIDKVFRSDRIISNGGKFHQQDLAVIWRGDEFVNMQGPLLLLMLNSKLCHETSPDNYLVPQLLSPQRPDYEWEESNNLVLNCIYEFMPEDMLTRFIVETQRGNIAQINLWKNGVVLEQNQTYAEVIEDYKNHKGEIRIRIVGKRKPDLLKIVIYELNKIHSLNKDLKSTMLVPCICSNCRNSRTPNAYEFEELNRFLDNKWSIQCHVSGESLNVRGLLEDVSLLGESDRKDSSHHGQERQKRASRPSEFGASITNIIHVAQHQENSSPMSTHINQNGLGDNIAGDKVMGDKIDTQINNAPDLANAAKEIKALLDQLSVDYPGDSHRVVGAKAVDYIDKDPQLKSRLLRGLKAGSFAALEKMIDHPIAKFFIEGAKATLES